ALRSPSTADAALRSPSAGGTGLVSGRVTSVGVGSLICLSRDDILECPRYARSIRGARPPLVQPARKVRRRRELPTTKTDENAMAAPAIMGFSSPAAASGRAPTL